MTARFHTRDGMKRNCLSRLPSPPRFHCAGHQQPPSQRLGVSWRALPVEGSAAWKRSRPILSRLFGVAR